MPTLVHLTIPTPLFFFLIEYPIISRSSIVPKRILELWVQPNIKLILLCVSHHKYKVRTQQNQVMLGPASHAKLQKGKRKRNIWSLKHANVGAMMHFAAFINEGLLLSGTLYALAFAVMSASYILYDPAHNKKRSETSMRTVIKSCVALQNPIWVLWLCFGGLMCVYSFLFRVSHGHTDCHEC